MAVATLSATAQEIEISAVDLMDGASTIYPTVLDSTLYFSSNHKWDLGKTYYDQHEDYLYQIFCVDLKNSKPHGSARRYLEGAGRPFNMFAITFDPDSTAYISQNNMDATIVRGAPISLYEYDSNHSSATGRRLETLPTKANCGMASISPDGELMIVASDQRGGEGRTDLYYCEKTNFGWSEPCNLGANINTPGIETAPYIHPSGKIFFASNGRDDSQGLDIYYTFKTDDGFADPVKFDKVVNGSKDDYGIYYSADEKWGYITSNRDGQDQLYYFRRTFPSFNQCDTLRSMDLCYTLYEASAENYDTTTFVCKWSFGDGTSAIGVEVDHCYEGPGIYNIELSVLDKTSEEEMFSLAQYELEIVKPDQVNIDVKDHIKAGQPTTFTASYDGDNTFVPQAYYWDFGNGERAKGERVTTTFENSGTYKIECGTIDARTKVETRCTYIIVTVE